MIPQYPDRDFEIKSFRLPSTHSGIVQATQGGLEIRHDLPVPRLEPHQLMVKTMAVALNPCDFKMHTRFPCPGAVDGCDFSGIVVAIGTDVSKTSLFRLGDGVFGAVHGSNPRSPATGSFAEYVVIDAEFTFKMPAKMSWTDAACIGGTGPGTLGLVLKEELRLSGSFTEPANQPVDVLVWGGASSIGAMAIQMIRRMGHRPITTCSPQNAQMARDNGAVHVFDYHDQNCSEQIKDVTRGNLRYVIDPFGEAKTMSQCYQCFGRAGGKYIALEVYPDALATKRSVQAKFVNGLSILGYPIELGAGYGVPASESRRALGVEWFQEVQKLVDGGGLRTHPVKHLETGFQSILDGLNLLSSRQVSAQKLVGRIGFDAMEISVGRR